MKNIVKDTIVGTFLVIAFILMSGSSFASGMKAVGQHVYVPVYSHIYGGNQERPFNLAVTLSIRNTDPRLSLSLMAVDYYNSEGTLLKHYVEKPVELAPMSAVRYVVKESDTSGGSGASFLVYWSAFQPVSIPVIESVMIGTQSQQGISFVSPGRVISE